MLWVLFKFSCDDWVDSEDPEDRFVGMMDECPMTGCPCSKWAARALTMGESGGSEARTNREG